MNYRYKNSGVSVEAEQFRTGLTPHFPFSEDFKYEYSNAEGWKAVNAIDGGSFFPKVQNKDWIVRMRPSGSDIKIYQICNDASFQETFE